MGQYHLTVNLDKRQFLDPHRLGDGAPPAAELDALRDRILALLNAPDPITAIYDAADPDDAPLLDEILERAGLIWTCPVRPWTNRWGEPCGECGRTEAEAAFAARQEQIEAIVADETVEPLPARYAWLED
jgi:hypothetical protein